MYVVLCCMRSEYEVNIFMVILEREREKKPLVWRCIIQKDERFSRNGETIKK